MLYRFIAVAAFLISLQGILPAAEKDYSNKEIGISLTLPAEDWNLTDQSQGSAKVLIFSPRADMSLRCCVLFLPKAVWPKGLESRKEQLKAAIGDRFEGRGLEADRLGGREAVRLDYAVGGALTKEYCLEDGAFHLMLQLSAPETEWEGKEGQMLDAIRVSFSFTGEAKVRKPEVDLKSPAEIRGLRRAMKQGKSTQDFEVARHRLEVEIEPAKHTLKAIDQITVRSKKTGLAAIRLFYSAVSVDRVESARSLSWQADPPDPMAGREGSSELCIDFEEPLAEDEEILVTVETSSNDFLLTVDQSLIQEIAVLGQVREVSSFSSHTFYYPIDEENDAAMEIALRVPEGFTAVSGGAPAGVETTEGYSTFRYKTEVRKHRALPFGFAVGRYIERSGASASGLPITVYGFAGEEKLIEQRRAVACEAADLFERMMGPLPFEAVRIAHIRPEEKEMGVSLPGLILVSDGFFDDIEGTDLSDGNMNRREASSLILIADELSHQWNFYSIPLPNELAEGVSTFTNLLYIEGRHGLEAYRKGVSYCASAYLMSTHLDREVAIADPAIYHTTAYRGIAFCKVPVVLDMLRTELGDDTFFAGWREVFRSFKGGGDGYEAIERIFSALAEKDLAPFFDQWFYRADRPRIHVEFAQQGDHLKLEIHQVQKGSPYRLDADLLIRGRGGEEQRTAVRLREMETTLTLACPFVVESAVFDPDDRVLKERVDD